MVMTAHQAQPATMHGESRRDQCSSPNDDATQFEQQEKGKEKGKEELEGPSKYLTILDGELVQVQGNPQNVGSKFAPHDLDRTLKAMTMA